MQHGKRDDIRESLSEPESCRTNTAEPAKLANVTDAPTPDPSVVHELLTVAEVAELLRFTVESIYQLVHRKKIPYVKLSGALRFKKSDIFGWIEECTFRPGQKKEQRAERKHRKAQTKRSSKMSPDVQRMVEQSRRKYLET